MRVELQGFEPGPPACHAGALPLRHSPASCPGEPARVDQGPTLPRAGGGRQPSSAQGSSLPVTGSGRVPALCSVSRQGRRGLSSTDHEQFASPPRACQRSSGVRAAGRSGARAVPPWRRHDEDLAGSECLERSATAGSARSATSVAGLAPPGRTSSPERQAVPALTVGRGDVGVEPALPVARRTSRAAAVGDHREPRSARPARPRSAAPGPGRTRRSRGRQRSEQAGGALGLLHADVVERDVGAGPGSGPRGSTRSGRGATGRPGAGVRTPARPAAGADAPVPARSGQLDRRAVPPDPLEGVVDALLGVLDVHDDVDVVEQDPAALAVALAADRLGAQSRAAAPRPRRRWP